MNAREKRTADVIDYYDGKPGEFLMLKGLLCLTHVDSCRPEAYALLDGIMIAKRMDELNNIALKDLGLVQ